MTQKHLRSIFISDTHLGNKNTQANHLLHFLETHTCDTLFLVGDIIDLWKMSKKGHWPTSHQKVLSKFFEIAASGTRVIYIPGNHDPFFRELANLQLGHIEVHQEYIHTLADGKRMLIVHGDCFDADVHYNKLLHRLGDLCYDSAVTINRWFASIRQYFGLRYWSLSTALKLKSKKAQSYIERFEQVAVKQAKARGMDGIICGHIHQGKLAEMDGIVYGNDGDWLESCSTIMEAADGRLSLLHVSKGYESKASELKPRPTFAATEA